MRTSTESEDRAGLDGMDDLDSYVATFTEQERDSLAVAQAAIDAAVARHRAGEHREPSSVAAAERSHLLATAATESSTAAKQPKPLSKLPDG